MIHVIGPRLLVELPPREAETVTASGIILTRDPDVRAPTRGIVVRIGDKRNTCDVDDVRAEVHTWFLDHPEESNVLYVRHELDRLLMKLAPAKFDVEVGEMVLFPASAGERVELDGIEYVILHESEVIAVVEPEAREAA